MTYFEECIDRQIAADRAKCADRNWKFQERVVEHHWIGDFIRAVLAIGTPEDARRFYEGHVAFIERQIEAGTWTSPCTAEVGACVNIGWCFGEGMAPERIAMWQKVCQAVHPIFGTIMPSPAEALMEGQHMGEAMREGG